MVSPPLGWLTTARRPRDWRGDAEAWRLTKYGKRFHEAKSERANSERPRAAGCRGGRRCCPERADREGQGAPAAALADAGVLHFPDRALRPGRHLQLLCLYRRHHEGSEPADAGGP